jgi:hypothetical protein
VNIFMSKNIRLKIASIMAPDHRQSLMDGIRSIYKVERDSERGFGAEWIAFVLLMKQVGTVAGGLTALLKLAEHIKSWRRKMVERGTPPAVILDQKLDLRIATDDEIDSWAVTHGQ